MLLAGLAFVVLVTSGLAWWQRPWRAQAGGLPWPWLALWLLLPLLWSPDRWSGVQAWPPASGAVLSVLLAGWPFTVLALAASALATLADGALSWSEALQRCFWLGTLPATLTALLGAAVARWRTCAAPRRPRAARADVVTEGLGFLLGRSFVGTLAAATLAATAGTAQGAAAGLLLGFAEASLTTMLLALLLACRPGWVAGWREQGCARAGA